MASNRCCRLLGTTLWTKANQADSSRNEHCVGRRQWLAVCQSHWWSLHMHCTHSVTWQRRPTGRWSAGPNYSCRECITLSMRRVCEQLAMTIRTWSDADRLLVTPRTLIDVTRGIPGNGEDAATCPYLRNPLCLYANQAGFWKYSMNRKQQVLVNCSSCLWLAVKVSATQLLWKTLNNLKLCTRKFIVEDLSKKIFSSMFSSLFSQNLEHFN